MGSKIEKSLIRANSKKKKKKKKKKMMLAVKAINESVLMISLVSLLSHI